jgi:hypothetical protein
MPRVSEKVMKSYQFLCEKEKTGQSFTKSELSEATGWAIRSVTAYLNKKLESFISRKGDEYYVQGIKSFKDEEYIRLMSQKDTLSKEPKKPLLPSEVEMFIQKARESAILAVDVYNRPGAIFRTEAFMVLMVIACNALFHAIFERNGVLYHYIDENGNPVKVDGELKIWELSKCVSEYFKDSTNPVKSNIEFMIGLRNKVEHRYLPGIDPNVAGECQAFLINFDELLVEKFGEYYAIKESLALPLQTTTLRSTAQIEAIKKHQGKHYDIVKQYIDVFRSGLPDSIYQDSKYSFRVYLIPKVGNHESSSDMALEFINYDPSHKDDIRNLDKIVALIKEQRIPVVNSGTFKPCQVAREVEKTIEKPFKIHHHTLAWKMYKIRKAGKEAKNCNSKYCHFDEPHQDYVYTQEWIDFLIKKLSSENEYRKLLASSKNKEQMNIFN